jgi:hypothetical protein
LLLQRIHQLLLQRIQRAIFYCGPAAQSAKG